MKEQDGRFNDWPNQDLNVNPLNYYLGALLAELSGPGYQNMAHNGTAWNKSLKRTRLGFEPGSIIHLSVVRNMAVLGLLNTLSKIII